MLRNKFVVAGVALALAASGAIFGQSAVARLGVNDNAGHEIVLSAMSGGYGFYNAASKSFLSLAPGARGMAVTEVVAWAKAYVNSPAFKQEWAKKRGNAMPKAPVVSGTVDDAAKSNAAQSQKQIDDMKKAIQNLPPDQRKAMEAVIAQAAAQMQASANDPQQQSIQRQAIAGQRADDQARYQDDLKKWQQDFPADPSPVIARRLKDFLAMSATVNFDAKLADQSGRKVFADPQYENKPDEWKICYRAGREATTAARSAATAWLKELGQ